MKEEKSTRMYIPGVNEILRIKDGSFESTEKGLAVFGLSNGKYYEEDEEGNTPYFGSPTVLMKVIPVLEDNKEKDNSWFAVEGKKEPRIFYIEKSLREVTRRDIFGTGILDKNEIVKYNHNGMNNFLSWGWSHGPSSYEFNEID